MDQKRSTDGAPDHTQNITEDYELLWSITKHHEAERSSTEHHEEGRSTYNLHFLLDSCYLFVVF